MFFPKKKRVSDRPLLDSYHTKHCVVCNRRGCDPCHIQSKGAGGDDLEINLMPLCRVHHIEQHKLGWSRFADKFSAIRLALLARGWDFDDLGRLRRV